MVSDHPPVSTPSESSSTLSAAQLRANRRNAQKSTGPKTPEGKARSSKNALKHGFCSTDIFMEGEDRCEFYRFRIEMLRFTRPRNIVEEQFSEQVIRGAWKLKRLQGAELEVLEDRIATLKRQGKTFTPGFALADLLWGDKEFSGQQRYERQMTSMMHRGIEQLRKCRKDEMPGILNDHAAQLVEDQKAKLDEIERNEANSTANDEPPTTCDEPEPALREQNRDIPLSADPIRRETRPHPPAPDARDG
jgi:hypothetical protein